MRNLLNKINLNRTRTIYFLATFVMIIGCYALNKSYSMFVQNESKKAVGANVPGLSTSLSVNTVSLGSKNQRLVKETITNNSSVPITYRLTATPTTPSNYEDYNIQMVDTDDNLSYGTVPANSTKEVYLVVTNLGTSATRIKFDLGQNYTTVNKDLNDYLATCNIDNIDKYVVTQNAPYSYQTLFNRYGDLNVDGKINEEDLNLINSNYLENLSSTQAKNNVIAEDYVIDYEAMRLYLTTSTRDEVKTQLTNNYSRMGTEVSTDVKIGDADGNGSINMNDVASAMRYILGNETYTENQKIAADCNQNGKVDYGDLAYIFLNYMGYDNDELIQKLIDNTYDKIGTRSNVETSYLNNAIMSTYVTSDLNSGEKNMFKRVTDIKSLMSGKTQLALPLEADLGIAAPSFTSVETAEKGLYQAEDDYGTTYYFRGASTKNYLKLLGGTGSKNLYTFTSNNKAKASTTATTTIVFTPTESGNLTFDWIVSSEQNYDKFTVKLNNTVVTDTNSVSINAVSGTKNGTVSTALTAGTEYTLTLTYTKDGSQDKNDDIGKIENLNIPSVLEPTVTTSGTYGFDKTVGSTVTYSIPDTIWRIVRINGDGTIRLVLDDVAKDSSGTVIKTAFKSSYKDNTYVGYMHGTAGSTTYDATHENINESKIKTKVDKWYEDNLKTNYANYLADTLFCNDKTLASSSIGSINTALGYGTKKTEYASTERLLYSTGTTSITTAKPTFKCAENATNDYSRFTVDVATLSNGKETNGDLKYPIGLLSADEVSFAGAYKYGQTNQSYYLYNSSITSDWWLLSPANYNGSLANANEWNVYYSSGSLSYSNVGNSSAFRPSINLKADILVDGGDGTSSNPYTVKIS